MFGFGVGPVELLLVASCAALVPLLVIGSVVFVVRSSGKRTNVTSGRLGTCPDCGRQVSLLAMSCPGCGRPLRPTS